MQPIPIEMISGHILLEICGARVLLDTGSPTSIGIQTEFSLFGRAIHLESSYMGITLEDVSQFVGTRVHVLLGADSLNYFDLVLDGVTQTANFLAGEVHLDGEPTSIDSFMGIPVVPGAIDSEQLTLFLDTGARLSYLDSSTAQGYPVVARQRDFYPGFGEFETDVRAVPLSIGSYTVVLHWGQLPSLLEGTLMTAGTRGIIGTEILDTFFLGLAMRRKILHLRKHEHPARRPARG